MSLTDRNHQTNQTRLCFNSLLEHTGSVRELYVSLQNKDTGGKQRALRFSSHDSPSARSDMQTRTHSHSSEHTHTLSLALNTGVTVRNAAQLVRPDEKSSTAAQLLSTTRDAVSKKFGSGVILRAKISNISTAMFLFVVFPFATEHKNTTLRSKKPYRAF